MLFIEQKKFNQLLRYNKFCKKANTTGMEAENFKANFLRILKNLLKNNLLLHFESNLVQIFRKFSYQYYKQLVESKDQSFFLINIFCKFFI